MWVATKKLEHEKFTVMEGMPIPHQQHAGFRERLRQLYGKDCIRHVGNVSPMQLSKVQVELVELRKENEKLKKQNEVLRQQLVIKPGNKVAA